MQTIAVLDKYLLFDNENKVESKKISINSKPLIKIVYDDFNEFVFCILSSRSINGNFIEDIYILNDYVYVDDNIIFKGKILRTDFIGMTINPYCDKERPQLCSIRIHSQVKYKDCVHVSAYDDYNYRNGLLKIIIVTFLK